MKRIIYLLIILLPTLGMAQSNKKILLSNEYYTNGNLYKARDLYKKLSMSRHNIHQIHKGYFKTLLSLEDYKSAEKHIKKIIRFFPNNVYYQIDQGILYQAMGNKRGAEKIFLTVMDNSKNNSYLIRAVAQHFINYQLMEYAIKSYQLARKNDRNKNSYALELANTYYLFDRKTEMIEEYLRFASIQPNNVLYIKNILQNLLEEDKDIENFQNILLDKIQKYPNYILYSELLIWTNLQKGDFYAAFIQARAVDRKNHSNGTRSMNIGKIALESKAYDEAIKIYTYVSETYPATGNYIVARRQIIKAREEKVKKEFPVELKAIRQLTSDYHQLIRDIGINSQTIEAYRNKALLHAFYLNEMDSAISILNEIMTVPRISQRLKSKNKLDLGDIYLLTGDHWEATLLYSQVEKNNKDSQLAYLAKLKNAKLNYYKGNFELAKSHLDILKLATTREIANNALRLSLLIQDNTALDTSDFVMKEYASIELLRFQNKKDTALFSLGEMLKKYPKHSLTDEILWQMASINMEQGNFESALLRLKSIQFNYPTDILGDDAMFLSAEIYETKLSDTESAMALYRDFMTKYPGSIHVAEARKRFRILRGDDIN